MDDSTGTISFDVLLKGTAGDATPTLANIDQHRPSPQVVEECFQWLTAREVKCHRTDFGLACETGAENFKKLFPKLIESEGPPSGKSENLTDSRPESTSENESTKFRIPNDLRELVAQVTICQPPTFFAGPMVGKAPEIESTEQ